MNVSTAVRDPVQAEKRWGAALHQREDLWRIQSALTGAYAGSVLAADVYRVDCSAALPEVRHQLVMSLWKAAGLAVVPLGVVSAVPGVLTGALDSVSRVVVGFLGAVTVVGIALTTLVARHWAVYRRLTRFTVAVSKHGVDYSLDDRCHRIPWRSIRRVESTARVLTVYAGRNGGPARALLIPTAALINAAEFRDVVRYFGGDEVTVRS